MTKLFLNSICVCIILLSLWGTGCVKVEYGQSPEEAVASSEDKARVLRASWAQELKEATPVESINLLVNQFNIAGNHLFQIGDEIIKRWHEGEVGRQNIISDSEMRKFVESWLLAQKPIFLAYEDNLEFGIELLKKNSFLQASQLDELDKLLESYYDNYSLIVYPQGTSVEYTNKIEQVKFEFRGKLEKFKSEIPQN